MLYAIITKNINKYKLANRLNGISWLHHVPFFVSAFYPTHPRISVFIVVTLNKLTKTGILTKEKFRFPVLQIL